ncbi:MAG: UDP-N-acetylglucosamine 2-epimerase (hydrolyzing) [Candidatus Omnitrophica bacterium]|nr:UDP-N-acetylglucosamine 2-epimerase (hydrolyzing) [Candidatus Omnitrophota bacterium]
MTKKSKKKICVFTGTRAEYGLLRPLMEEVRKDKAFKLQIVASAMHLLPEFGSTYKEIERDGLKIDEKVKIFLEDDTPVGINRSVSSAILKLSKAFVKLKPDMVVILGDRFEAFSAATAAMIWRIPIAHINGGEATFGVIDEAIRHSITKMSHLHFTSTDEYRKRVIQLGEQPDRVFNVGATGLDSIKRMKFLSKKDLEKELSFKFAKRNLLVTFHPVTLEKGTSKKQFGNLLNVLDSLKGTHIIFTMANADTEGRIINKMIDKYVAKRPYKSKAFISMGQRKYLSTMQFVDAVVGNSSSGIIEAPSFKIGTVNIGDRQKGRIRTESIIDCSPRKEDIKKAIRKLYTPEFQKTLKRIKSPYGDGSASKRIAKIIKTVKGLLLKKEFYNIRWRI